MEIARGAKDWTKTHLEAQSGTGFCRPIKKRGLRLGKISHRITPKVADWPQNTGIPAPLRVLKGEPDQDPFSGE
jgi:hypothetical protein